MCCLGWQHSVMKVICKQCRERLIVADDELEAECPACDAELDLDPETPADLEDAYP